MEEEIASSIWLLSLWPSSFHPAASSSSLSTLYLKGHQWDKWVAAVGKGGQEVTDHMYDGQLMCCLELPLVVKRIMTGRQETLPVRLV